MKLSAMMWWMIEQEDVNNAMGNFEEPEEEIPAVIVPQEELAIVDITGKLIAKRDIRRGEIILVEKAYLSVPDPGVEFGRGGCDEELEHYSPKNWQSSNKKICTSCYSSNPAEEIFTECDNCRSPMCSMLCSLALNHARECEVLAQLRKTESIAQILDSETNNQIFCDFVAVIRFLMFKMESYPTNLIILAALSPIDDLYRVGHSATLRSANIKIFTTLFESLGKCLLPAFNSGKGNASLVDYGFSILNIIKRRGLPHQAQENCFSRYFSRLASFIGHSCVPNVDVALYKSGEIRVKALRDISNGEDLVGCFISLLRPTYDRHAVLQVQRLVDCKCERCLDPTELGSYIGSIKCSIGKDCASSGGLLVMKSNPNLQEQSDTMWECTKCGTLKNHNSVLEVVEKSILSIKAMTSTEEIDVEEVSKKLAYITYMQGPLYAGNWLVLLMKKKLVNLMGWDYGICTWKIERSVINRKLFLLIDIVDAYKKLGCEFSPLSVRLQLQMMNLRSQNFKHENGEHIQNLRDLPEDEMKKLKEQGAQIYDCLNHHDSLSCYGDAKFLAYKYVRDIGVKFCTVTV